MNREDTLGPPHPLIPRRPVPDLELSTVEGPTWRLSDEEPENFTLLVFYRGLHCPICRKYLNELQDLLPDLAERGVRVVAVSSDDGERAARARSEWGLPDLTIAHGLDLADAREWGLYVSSGRHGEPDLFSEPGLFMIRPDGTLYFAAVQSMPFARPDLGALVGALDFVLKEDYPARGEIVGEPVAAA